MTTTPDLGLPLISAQQQQPEVTHNEAMYLLSAALNGVIAVLQNAPPGSPTVGDTYVVGAAPSGAWVGYAKHVATYTAGGWRFLPGRNDAGTIIAMGSRQEGMRVWLRGDANSPDTSALYRFTGSTWQQVTIQSLPQMDLGELDVTNNATVIAKTAAVDPTLLTNSDYTQITGVWDAIPHGQNQGITQSTNSFTVSKTGIYEVSLWNTVFSSVNNTTVAFRYGVNGVISLGRRPRVKLANANERANLSAFGRRLLNAGDVVTLWVASDTTANITIEDQVFATKLLRQT